MSDPDHFTRAKKFFQMIWLDGWFLGGAFVALLIVLAATWALNFNPERHRRDGFVIADVLSVFDASSKTRRRLWVQLHLPDGSLHALPVGSTAALGGIAEQACLERHRFDSGSSQYRLTRWEHCQPGSAE
ncbi:MAG: hypothetical protein P1U83_04730 [Roseovarius sp.]|nr:hypothetical protein [Roseovarius sp.]